MGLTVIPIFIVFRGVWWFAVSRKSLASTSNDKIFYWSLYFGPIALLIFLSRWYEAIKFSFIFVLIILIIERLFGYGWNRLFATYATPAKPIGAKDALVNVIVSIMFIIVALALIIGGGILISAL